MTPDRAPSWLKVARSHRGSGEFIPAGWSRSFTIDNLVAELSQRADRYDYSKPALKKKRQEKARKK